MRRIRIQSMHRNTLMRPMVKLRRLWRKQSAWQRLLMLSPMIIILSVLLIILQGVENRPIEPSKVESELSMPIQIDINDDWRLMLVNQTHMLHEGYKPDLSEVDGIDEYFDSRAAGRLEDMLEAARKEGLSPIICSAYRNIEQQSELYYQQKIQFMAMGYTLKEAETEAAKSVAPPGTSEHGLGLAVDIVSEEFQLLTKEQEDTPENIWLRENCWRFGFVVRYPDGKQDITGIIYEPWHFRYVGKEHAKEITEQRLCLEEYIERLESKT